MTYISSISKHLSDILDSDYVNDKPWSLNLKQSFSIQGVDYVGSLRGSEKNNASLQASRTLCNTNFQGNIDLSGYTCLKIIKKFASAQSLSVGLDCGANLNSPKSSINASSVLEYNKPRYGIYIAGFWPLKTWTAAVRSSLLAGNCAVTGCVETRGDFKSIANITGAGLVLESSQFKNSVSLSATVTQLSRTSFGHLTCGMSCQSSNSSAFGARLSLNAKSLEKNLEIGIAKTLDKDTMGRAKINNFGIATISLIRNLDYRAKLIVSTSVS